MTTVTTPKAVALKGVPDVELVAVGKWNAGTGVATITDDDVRAAVAALDCPGVHNPVIKLGHQEPDPDASRIRWDGEPAVGWISNMRLSDNSAKVIGDYTGVPAWLVDVMPSAYPQRSVEIQRDFLCQIGHVHPFVITAVSLLGVAPPAVGVIKSLHDVQALYTLAAADGHPPAEVTTSIAHALALPADERRPLTDTEVRSGADFDRDRDEWDAAVAALLSAYGMVQRRQREQLTAQIAPLVDAERYGDLAALTVDPQPAADLIYAEMLLAAQAAIDLQIVEAATQGMIGLTAVPDEFYLRRVADGIAATMAASMAATAGRDAAQLAAPGVAGATVADSVNAKLSDLSDRFLRDQFSGAIGAARTAGRHAVLSVAPDGTYYAAEVNDRNTCAACKKIDGTRFPDLDAAMAAYGAGGYHLCSGGERCRGRMITVWEAAMPVRMSVVGLRVGDRVFLARVADALPPKVDAVDTTPLRLAPSGPGRTLVLKFDPMQKRDRDGKWTDGTPDAPSGEGDGHTRGTKFDTPVDTYGMKYSATAASNPRVKELKTDTDAWAEVPTEAYPMKDANLIATEEYLRSKPIDKVVSGKEPFREGYDAHILRTDEGDVVIDGHHRVAMYAALDRKTMPAKIIDERSSVTKKPEAGLSDAELMKTKPWVKGDRGPGAPGVVYTDEAELSAYRILDNYARVEPKITESLSDVAGKHKGSMEGLKYKLKGQESLARKIEQKSATKGLTMKQYAAKIGDALRYTMVLPADRYGRGAQEAIEDFRRQGYTVEVENTWKPGASYKGINTNMKKDGVIFEVQFHTPQSLSLKQSAHGLYEVARDATASPEERAAATKKMIDNARALPDPAGAGDVK